MELFEAVGRIGNGFMSLVDELKFYAAEAREWRRELHRHPQTSYEEEYASTFISGKLEEMGIEYDRGLAGTGVVGVIEGKLGGNRAIGLRADMDALDISERGDSAWKSIYDGKMHACGHDGHVAMLLCAGKYLSENRDFSGRCYLIFQPAEEGGAGAKRMMDEGLFDRFPMDSVWGMHNWPSKKVGWFGFRAGATMASTDIFSITVRGKGVHAAMPDRGIDPILITAHIVIGLQSIVSRRISPMDEAVVSITVIDGGSANNVIPDEVTIKGTVRTLSKEAFDLVKCEVERISKGIAESLGGEAVCDYSRSYPCLVNSVDETNIAEEVATDLVGEDNIERTEGFMGGEDFAFMLEEKPGSYIFLGNGENSSELHSATYDFNDDAIAYGASYWVKLTQRLLSI